MRRRWKAEKRKEQRKDAITADRAALDKAGLRAARKRKMAEQHAAQHAKRAHLEAPHARLLALHPEDVAPHAPGHGVGAPVGRDGGCSSASASAGRVQDAESHEPIVLLSALTCYVCK